MAASAKREAGMIFLKEQNMIVEEAVGTRLFDEQPRREPSDITEADFDDVRYKVLVKGDATNYISVHISLGAVGAKIKKEYYGPEVMARVYGPLEVAAEPGFDFAVGFDLDAVAPADKEPLLRKVAAMRKHLLGAPVYKALQGIKDGNGGSLPLMVLETRAKEGMFVKPGNDRCTIVFAFAFPDETDNAVARVMLQQFAKEGPKVNGAPPCSYAEAKNPPMEIRELPKVGSFTDGCGFMSFVVFASHISTPAKMDKVIGMLTSFRNYLLYHIKASKTYLHMRMRKKVNGWLQVLNKSHHEKTEKEAKTAGGKTFKRAGVAVIAASGK
jgi:actin related protein 2/3 complex subunit 2